MNKHTDTIRKLTCLSGFILFLSSGILSAETFVREESREFNAADFKTVEVRTMSGDVAVENTDGSMILVNILMSVKASSEEKAETAFENMDISFETLSDLLKVEVKGGSSGLSFLGIGKLYPNVRVEIKCPAGIGLDVDTGSGDVLGKELEGEFVAGTGSGDISATGKFSHFKAGAGSGDIHIVTDSPVEKDSKASTGSGDVLLKLPPESNFFLKASSGSGDIRLQFLPAGDIKTRDSLEMQVGDQGPTIRTVSGSGDIAVFAGD